MAVVKTLPAPEKTLRILELIEAETPTKEIVREVFGQLRPECTTVVKLMQENPDGFDTYVDEVAVHRALQGEAGVWAALTHYERREAMIRVWARREQERAEDLEDQRSLKMHSGTFNYVRPNGMAPAWLQAIADANGVDVGRIVDDARAVVKARGV